MYSKVFFFMANCVFMPKGKLPQQIGESEMCEIFAWIKLSKLFPSWRPISPFPFLLSFPLLPSPCHANSLFIAISGIYQFQLKNSHDFGNGRARCLPFANTSRLLFSVSPPPLSLALFVSF